MCSSKDRLVPTPGCQGSSWYWDRVLCLWPPGRDPNPELETPSHRPAPAMSRAPVLGRPHPRQATGSESKTQARKSPELVPAPRCLPGLLKMPQSFLTKKKPTSSVIKTKQPPGVGGRLPLHGLHVVPFLQELQNSIHGIKGKNQNNKKACC